jgi:hypothetical protein
MFQKPRLLSEADHLIHFKGGRWALWRCVCLRGAGFPASDVLKLGSAECAACSLAREAFK